MEDTQEGQAVDALVKAHFQYRLADFADILTEVLAHWGSLDGLKGLDVLELGPHTKVAMMRFLASSVGVKSMRGVGETVLWPWDVASGLSPRPCGGFPVLTLL